jgi:hypothetical protein
MSADQVIMEARARIIWGESSSSVHDFLTSNGVPEAIADAKLVEFVLERSRELRRIGLRDLLVGIVLVSVSGITSYLLLSVARLGGGWLTSGSLKVDGLALLAGAYGLWKIGRGVVYLVGPQSGNKSIPDIIASDDIH